MKVLRPAYQLSTWRSIGAERLGKCKVDWIRPCVKCNVKTADAWCVMRDAWHQSHATPFLARVPGHQNNHDTCVTYTQFLAAKSPCTILLLARYCIPFAIWIPMWTKSAVVRDWRSEWRMRKTREQRASNEGVGVRRGTPLPISRQNFPNCPAHVHWQWALHLRWMDNLKIR